MQGYFSYANTYVGMLFVDFISAFNTVIPHKLILNLHNKTMLPSIYHWIKDFLTNRFQVMKMGYNTSSTLVLSTGTPQSFVLSQPFSLSSPLTVLPSTPQTAQVFKMA